MQKVLILTPVYTGQLPVMWVKALVETMTALRKSFDITPVFTSSDALIQRTRDVLVQTALELNPDMVVWIDGDVIWKPMDFLHLLEGPDFVSGLYRQKKDPPAEYVLRLPSRQRNMRFPAGTRYVKIDGCGFGFVKWSRKVLDEMWAAAPEYRDGPDKRREVFRIWTRQNPVPGSDVPALEIVGEDMYACDRWLEMDPSHEIFADITVTVDHLGSKLYEGAIQVVEEE